MGITRKVCVAISLVAVIPLLVTLYLFINTSISAFSTRASVIFITCLIGILGVIVFINLTRMLTKLYNSIQNIAMGDIDHKAEVSTSSGIADLAVSINQVSRRLRENADELERRAILIERSNQELQRASKTKLMYLSDIVHELRAPLINIDNGSTILLEKISGAMDAEQRNFLKVVNDNAKRLIRLTNDLLDMSKMEAGYLSLNYQLICVKEVINDAINSVDNWRKNKNIRLEIRISSDLPKLYADRDRIIQAIVNLLGNAIKYTPYKGEIIIEAKRFNAGKEIKPLSHTKNDEIFIEISVQDNGTGIPGNQKDKIFDRYSTVQDASFNTVPNTGLGLPITKQIVEMHGGRIWMEGQLGKGSKFTFILPQRLKRELKEHNVAFQKSEKRILIIEDEGDIRQLLGRELYKKGYFVTVARDGLEGIKEALEHYYDLVITDIRMPKIDGVDCIKILKKVNPKQFFIVITGFPVGQDLEEILKREAYPCIRKPFDLQDLLKTVEGSSPILVQN